VSARAAAALAFGLALAPLTSWAETVTFTDAAVGALPPGFETALTGKGQAGLWAVVEDTSAEGKRALEQRAADPTDYRFPLAVYGPATARDVEATIRFKAVSGKVDQAGGVAVRLSDAGNYYLVRANALEDNVHFYRVVRGRRQELKGIDTRVTGGEWHTLSLRAQGSRFTVSFDGKELFTATDRTFAGEGRVALWTKADSITRFDELKIETLQ
jgi:hypothetical protein